MTTRRRSYSPLQSLFVKLSTISAITVLLLCLAFVSTLALAFALPESDQQLSGASNGTRNGSELSSGPRSRPKEDSFADMIDRALEKEFTENDKDEGLCFRSEFLTVYITSFYCFAHSVLQTFAIFCVKLDKYEIVTVELATGDDL